jgi:Smg protein
MYDVLVYVFENCQQAEVAHQADRVAKKLSAAGFEDSDISEALHWLAGVFSGPHAALAHLPDTKRSFRAFAARELAKLDAQCRGFLLTLEQLKLIVLMVMWNQQTPTSRLVAEELFSAPGARLAS